MPPRRRAAYLGDLDEYRNEPVGSGPDTVAAGDDPRFTASGFLVTEYGTPGANDLVMIQAAITAAAPFGAWVLINGDRPISGTLNVPSGSRIDMSQGRITQAGTLTPTFKLLNVSNVRFRNVRIVGKGTDHVDSSSVYGASGIWLAGTTSDVIVEGGAITAVTGAGILTDVGVTDFHIRNVKIVGPGAPAITAVTTNYGACVALFGGNNFDITGCEFSQHGQGITSGEINDFRIANNYVPNMIGQHGFYLEPGARFTITGNVIKDTALQGIKLQLATTVWPDADMGVISGNSISNTGSHAILLTNTAGGTPRLRRIMVSGNTLSTNGAGGDGIDLIYANNVSVVGNIIHNGRHGISTANCAGLTLNANRIYNSQFNGISVLDTTDSEVVNNRIVDPGSADTVGSEYGIQVTGASSGIKVDGNTVSDSAGHMRYGLYLSMTGSGQASCVIRNNDFSGATDYGARLDNTQSIKEWANNVCSGTLGEILNFPTAQIVKGSTRSVYTGTAAPVAGTYRAGDRVEYPAPVAGGFMGVVCTVAGTPGTWKTYGPVSA
jgi:parallel beta-helix repeat protein